MAVAAQDATGSTKGDRTRRRLLEIAVRRFAADGFRRTSVSGIARDAGISPASAYAYFPSKEDIVFWAYRPGIERLQARLATRQPGETVLDAVSAWVRGGEGEPIDWLSGSTVEAACANETMPTR